MGEAGYNTTALQATIKSGLQFTATLLAVGNDIIHNGECDNKFNQTSSIQAYQYITGM
jgi:hypothetical protein